MPPLFHGFPGGTDRPIPVAKGLPAVTSDLVRRNFIGKLWNLISPSSQIDLSSRFDSFMWVKLKVLRYCLTSHIFGSSIAMLSSDPVVRLPCPVAGPPYVP